MTRHRVIYRTPQFAPSPKDRGEERPWPRRPLARRGESLRTSHRAKNPCSLWLGLTHLFAVEIGHPFIPPNPSSLFIYQSSSMWNKCRKISSKTDFTTPIASVKTRLRKAILDAQIRYDPIMWCPLNFDLSFMA